MCDISVSRGWQGGRGDAPSGNGQCVGVESSELLGPLMEVIVPLLDPPWN
jgi:hypothetical protein